MQKILAIAWKDIPAALRRPGRMAVLPDPADRLHPRPGRRHRRLRPTPASAWWWWTRPAPPLSAELIAALGKSAGGPPGRAAAGDGREPVLAAAASRRCWSSRPSSTWRSSSRGGCELELRQQPNNLNALVAYRAVQAVISRVSSAVDIAKQQRGRGRTHPALCVSGGRARLISTPPWRRRKL